MGAAARGGDTRIYIISGLLVLRTAAHTVRVADKRDSSPLGCEERAHVTTKAPAAAKVGDKQVAKQKRTENRVLDTFAMSEYPNGAWQARNCNTQRQPLP